MSFFSNPIVICSIVASSIVFLLIIVVVICCKRSSDKEREELKMISEEIESDMCEESVSCAGDDKIEEVLTKMQEALDVKQEHAVSFEQEQEENAIISYQELLASFGNNGNIDIDSIQVFDDELDGKVEISDFNKEIIDAYQNENLDNEIYKFQNDYSSQELPIDVPTSLDESIDFNSIVENYNFSDEVSFNDVESLDTVSFDNVESLDDVQIDLPQNSNEVYEAKHVVGNHKFKSSEIISPVYGIINKTTDYGVINKKDEVEEIIFDDESFQLICILKIVL